MKILITGGLGFLGGHLMEHFLRKGHEVTVLNTSSDRAEKILASFEKKPKVVWGSITDKELVKKTVRDHAVVFHLAAYVNVDESVKDPRSFFDVNIGGTVNVLEAIREYGNRLVYASTCEVYGNVPGRTMIHEGAELRPHSPYAASKAAADRICFSYCKSYGVDVSIIRAFNIFGERQKEGEYGALIPILVRRALNGENLRIFGGGAQTRDYMYVADLLDGYDLIFNSKNTGGEVYNLGTGKETAVKDIAEYVAKKLGVEVEYTASRPGEVSRFCADIAKAEKLGFKPKFDIWQGIDRYIEWRKNQ
jgi:dTDP-glucose 4,6-dehydratase